MTAMGLRRRARRALERQLDYQRRKAETLRGREAEIIAAMIEHSARFGTSSPQFARFRRMRGCWRLALAHMG